MNATLRLYHPSSTPEEASAVMRLEPTFTQISSPDRVGRRPNGWFFASGEHPLLSSSLEALFSKLNIDRLDVLRSQGWNADVLCSVESRGGSVFFAIPPKVCLDAGRLGLTLEVLSFLDTD